MSQVCIVRRISSIVTVAGIVIAIGSSDVIWSQSPKAKAKPSAKSPTDLDEEFAKYAAPLTGEASPIAIGKTVTISLPTGKTLTDFEVTELQVGKGDETLKFLSIQDADGKKKQKLVSSAIARIRSGDHSYDVMLVLLAHLTPSTNNFTTVEMTIIARARPVAYAQPYARCGGRGALDERFMQLLKAELLRR